MLQDELTAAQRFAIQKLIRAKSDREIARLLRKSYHLLNPGRRRRSSVSHGTRWSNYELRLLGRIRDEELAKLLRRSPIAVKGRRESLNIPIFAPQRIRWSRREIELLGKRPDPIVARMLGRTKYSVQLKRHSLGIPHCWEDRRAWTPSQCYSGHLSFGFEPKGFAKLLHRRLQFGIRFRAVISVEPADRIQVIADGTSVSNMFDDASDRFVIRRGLFRRPFSLLDYSFKCVHSVLSRRL